MKNISDFRKEYLRKKKKMVVDANKYLGEMKANASEDLAPIWARIGERFTEIRMLNSEHRYVRLFPNLHSERGYGCRIS
jgi:hypothetical protein